MGRCAALFLLLSTCTMATAQSGIAIDQDFADWSEVPSIAVSDTVGPLVAVGFTSDAERIYFHLEYDRTLFNIQFDMNVRCCCVWR